MNQVELNDICLELKEETAFSGEESYLDSLNVYYISDLHLTHYLKNVDCQFQEDNENLSTKVKNKIEQLVKNIFPDEIEKDFSFHRYPIVLIAGDTSPCIKLNKFFYDRLLVRYEYFYYKYWKRNNIQKEAVLTEYAESEYNKNLADLEARFIKEVNKIKKTGFDFNVLDNLDYDDIESFLEGENLPTWFPYLFSKATSLKTKIKEFKSRKKEFIQRLTDGVVFRKQKTLPIYITLGNHELSEFETVDKCEEAYNGVLNRRISLLERSGFEYKKYMIIGGIGLAGKNELYNCRTIITTNPPLQRDEEINISKEFSNLHSEIKTLAVQKKKPLIVVSHYHPEDWLYDEYDVFATYFAGHTHRNERSIVNGSTVFSDNQVGYNAKSIKFKRVTLGTRYNPFVRHVDGYYEIEVGDYEAFLLYSNERIQGTEVIKGQINKYGAKLYMIKHGGFYGFFLLNPKTGVKICEGGRIRNIGKNTEIDYYYKKFPYVLNKYLSVMAPYRMLQNKISNKLKELGFDGHIHGCIVDVDFFNHILVDPIDGKIHFYNSPSFGEINRYSSFKDLLLNNGNSINIRYELIDEISKLNNVESLSLPQGKGVSIIVENFHVGRKNSVYAFSERINQLQRLFNSNILRLWSDDCYLLEANKT